MEEPPGASGSAQSPGDSPTHGTYTDEQMAQMGLEAYYNEPEPNKEIIGFHEARSAVSTNAP
eukprot:6475226-Karenia_brevis.AAC.1